MLRFKIFKKVGTVVSLPTIRKVLDFIKHYIFGLFKRMDDHNIFFTGAGISFSLFIGVIPLILLVFSLLGIIFDQASIEAQFNTAIDQAIPYPAYASYVKRLILARLPDVIESRTLAGVIGAFGLLLTSSWIFTSIRTILNQIFHVKMKEGFFFGLVRDILMVILVLFLITLSTFVFPSLNYFSELLRNYDFIRAFKTSIFWNVGAYMLSFIIMFAMFFVLYYLLPYEQLGKAVAAVSAFWSAFLWELARILFGYYVNNMLKTSPIYGAFVLIVAILFWVYYSACLFIVGAEIGQLYRERHHESYRVKKKQNTVPVS
jgi:membrane protein